MIASIPIVVSPQVSSPELPAVTVNSPGLVECGRASEHTRGQPNLPLYELGAPPFDRVFVAEDEIA